MRRWTQYMIFSASDQWFSNRYSSFSSFKLSINNQSINSHLSTSRSLTNQSIQCMISIFSAISVELYYIFATLWGREQYTLYGILFIVYGILLSVTACISVALTYFQLSAEDYRWWWRSIFSAGYVAMVTKICNIVFIQPQNILWSYVMALLSSLSFYWRILLNCEPNVT